jgi:hypothetical protein
VTKQGGHGLGLCPPYWSFRSDMIPPNARPAARELLAMTTGRPQHSLRPSRSTAGRRRDLARLRPQHCVHRLRYRRRGWPDTMPVADQLDGVRCRERGDLIQSRMSPAPPLGKWATGPVSFFRLFNLAVIFGDQGELICPLSTSPLENRNLLGKNY